MTVDLHNHTARCNHATGTMAEYVQKAIDEQTDIFGFSDHAPMDFDPKYRMDFSQMQSYENEVLALKATYKDDISITLGYEVDFLPGHIDKRVLHANVDYLIGSVHFLDDWGFDNPEFLSRYDKKDIDTIYADYFAAIEALAQSGHFQIVGHLDLIKVFKYYPKQSVLQLANRALDAIKDNGLTLELNSAGYRKPCAEAYPSQSLLNAAFTRDIPITFGSDAHAVDQVALNRTRLQDFAKSVGYTQCDYFIEKERISVAF